MYEQFEYSDDERGKEDLSADEGGYIFGLQDEEEERVCPDEENAPTFRIQRRSVTQSEVGAKSPEYGKFVSMCPTSTHLVLGTKFNYILRWDITDETSTVARIEPKAKVTLSKVFASGADVLVACREGSNYYINFKTSKKPKPVLLNAMKGLYVTCMASKGGKVVVGTKQGDIFEVDFTARRATKVFTITDNKSQPVPILDMEMETFPTDPNKYLICAATSNKLYEFVTLNNMESSFKKYHNIKKGEYMREVPGNCLTSEIKFHSEHGSANTVIWITEVAIVMYMLRWGAQDIGERVTSEPDERGVIRLEPLKITSMAISPITILAFGSHEGQSEQHLMAINRLSQVIRTVANLGKETYGRALKLSHISSSTKRSYGRNFLLTKDYLLEIDIINEDKELSGIYLSRQEFDLAKKFAKDATQRQTILATEAQHLFDRRMFQEAAKKYAELTTNHDARKYAELTHNLDPVENINVSLRIPTFEEIALKFVKHNAQDALLKFLITKLERTDEKQSLQRTILASWIVESMLEKIGREKGREKTNYEERERTTATLDQFLKDYSLDLPPDSTIELISSHGQSKQLLHYAECIEDSRFVVESHIQNREFRKAVEVLKQHPKPEDIYFFAPTLINRATKSFTELLMKVKNLDSKKLLPALQKTKPGESDFVIKYLEYLVKNHNRQPAIHNLLASLYSQVDHTEDRLLDFIKSQENNPIFDLKFILRICHHENHPKSCCAIYKILGLHESAVKEALRANDVELAKSIARERDNSDNRTNDKKLWLLIARYVIELNHTSKALEIVRMSDLNIEDILPHLPDFVEMKDFKNDVLKSLENHNKEIERLKQDMKRYTRSADDLRGDIERQTRQPATCTSSNLCDLSDKPILGHKFLLFPCTHVFRVEELRKKLYEYRHVVDEKALGAQCPLCGLVMIEETSNIFKDE